MIKIFQTADNHFGKRYGKHSAKDKIIELRMSAFKDMVDEANRIGSHIFAISGDLFDRPKEIDRSLVRNVVQILSEFSGWVLVLPGNHDHYDPALSDSVWIDFEGESAPYGNIILLKEFREYSFEIAGQQVSVYPAFCQSKHSSENNLGWIKALNIPKDDTYRIVMAHGALAGLSPDEENRYFGMTIGELKTVPADVFLIGHTHMPYPDTLCEDRFVNGHKVFNPGTHAQTDCGNRTPGYCFEIEIDDDKTVRAKKFMSGSVFFHRETVNVDLNIGLRDSILKLINKYPDNAVVEINVKGSIPREEYDSRGNIYNSLSNRFLEFKITDPDLAVEISEQFVKDTFAETSFAAKALSRLMNEPKEAQMLYELIDECRD